jgi:hypothetical protein
MSLLHALGRRIARFLSRPRDEGAFVATSSRDKLAATLKRGDVLLVEGTSHFATAIKYLTQSTWSHSALYIGGEELIEADINEGVRRVPLSNFWHLHTRICRPVGLSAGEVDAVVNYCLARLGHYYDLKNIFDLARWLFPTPPVPRRLRRKLLALGSGDPTRAICSTLVAQAYQAIQYPILPEIYLEAGEAGADMDVREWLHIRHHSLYAPRDFDVSPYFAIVKPMLSSEFDFRSLDWADTQRLRTLDGPLRPA